VTIAAGTLKYTQNNACLYNWQEKLIPIKDQHIQFYMSPQHRSSTNHTTTAAALYQPNLLEHAKLCRNFWINKNFDHLKNSLVIYHFIWNKEELPDQ
jgi:hypothetical protein